jgi:hypothetical protein
MNTIENDINKKLNKIFDYDRGLLDKDGLYIILY